MIFNIDSVFALFSPQGGLIIKTETVKMNFNNKKTQKTISTVIIVLVILGMLIPLFASALK